MTNYGDILKLFIRRGGLAVPLFLIAWLMPPNFYTPFLILAGAVLLGIPAAGFLSDAFCSMMESRGHFEEKPQPMYSIPQSRKASGLYEEAMRGFEEIAAQYPAERQPYVEMIDIAIVHLRDPERARALFERGMAALQTDADRQALAVMYAAIRSRLEERPKPALKGGGKAEG